MGSLAHGNRWDELVCLAGLSDEMHGTCLDKHRGPRLAAIPLQLLQPPLLPCLAVQLPMCTHYSEALPVGPQSVLQALSRRLKERCRGKGQRACSAPCTCREVVIVKAARK